MNMTSCPSDTYSILHRYSLQIIKFVVIFSQRVYTHFITLHLFYSDTLYL